MLTRFRNKSAEVNKRIRLTPVNGAIANISESQGAVAKDGEDVLICLSPMVEEQPTISCDDSPSSIVLPLSGGAMYEIVDGDAIYGDLIRHLIAGARDGTYFEGLRFEVVTGDDIDPITVRIVNLTDNPKRIKFTALDADYLNESYFADNGLNYAETALAHNVESLDNDRVFEFCLGPTGEDGDDEVEEPLWDIKYKVNGEWVYEVTGPVVESSDSRNSQYRGLATELVVSDRVTEIGYLAFRYWSNLVSVDLGNTVRSISNYAFEACTGLKDIVFSNSLEVIGDNSFGGCQSLEVLDFGENLHTINSWALVNLYKLHTIVFRSDPPVTFGDNVFGNGSSGGTKPQYVYVPDHLVDEYYDILKFRISSVSIDRNNCRPLSQYNG